MGNLQSGCEYGSQMGTGPPFLLTVLPEEVAAASTPVSISAARAAVVIFFIGFSPEPKCRDCFVTGPVS